MACEKLHICSAIYLSLTQSILSRVALAVPVAVAHHQPYPDVPNISLLNHGQALPRSLAELNTVI